MTIAIVAEDFAGMRAQATGLTERAGYGWTFHPVTRIGFWSRLPFRFCPYPLSAVEPIDLPSGTEAIVSVGGTGGVAGAALAQKLGLPVVQIQNPRTALNHFNLVVANCHDGIEGDNVILSRTAMHGMTPQRLQIARTHWAPRLRPDGRKLLSVLVGGANGRFRFGPEDARALGEGLAKAAREGDAAVVLTPSRRTSPDVIAALREALAPVEAFIWDGTGENPYAGLLACADLVVVTKDSVSMVSEAVATAVPVLVADMPGRSRRIDAFVQALRETGRIRSFASRWETWDVSPLDDTPIAAAALRGLLDR